MQVAVVVPCYNESQRLNQDQFLEVAAHPNLHLYFVNDGSTDSTLDALESMRSKLPESIHVIELEKNVGKANAVRQGVLLASKGDYDWITYYDADLATPTSELLRIVKDILPKTKSRVILGARIKRLGSQIERTSKRHYLGRIFATFASLILHMPVYDTQCGFKLFRNQPQIIGQFEKPFTSRWIFDVELIARIHSRGLVSESEFLEVPLLAWKDIGGSTLKTSAMFRAAIELFLLHFKLSKLHSES